MLVSGNMVMSEATDVLPLCPSWSPSEMLAWEGCLSRPPVHRVEFGAADSRWVCQRREYWIVWLHSVD